MKKTFLYITAMIIIVLTCISTVSASEIEQLEFNYVVIPLTHHKNSGYTELRVLGVYLSPACGGGKNI